MGKLIYQINNVPIELKNFLIPILNDLHNVEILDILKIEKRGRNEWIDFQYIITDVKLEDNKLDQGRLTLGIPHFHEKYIDRHFKLKKLLKKLNLGL